METQDHKLTGDLHSRKGNNVCLGCKLLLIGCVSGGTARSDTELVAFLARTRGCNQWFVQEGNLLPNQCDFTFTIVRQQWDWGLRGCPRPLQKEPFPTEELWNSPV